MVKSPRRVRVAEAVRKIRAFYNLGRAIPRKQPHRDAYSRHVVAAEADRHGTNEDYVRKARQFADPVEGYSRQELNELVRLIKGVQPGQDDRKAIFGTTHLLRLLTVRPRRRRAALQRRAVEGGWSLSQLKLEIAKSFGTRRDGGRRRRIPSDRMAFLTLVEAQCEQWRRLRAELDREPGAGEARHVLLADLPQGLQERITAVSAAVGQLQQAAVAELAQGQPERAARVIFRGE
jgi:hypothetical protein